MCRKRDTCVELGIDQNTWDKFCVLTPKNWFDQELDKFIGAVSFYISGDRNKCIDIVNGLRSQEMQDWYIEHAQVAGRIRKNITKILRPDAIPKEHQDKKRMPNKSETKMIFERDGYRCRYCQRRILAREFSDLFVNSLDHDGFQYGNTNASTHGVLLLHKPVVDHVVPHNIGGRTDSSNLVTSCYPCNFGKDQWTLEQILNIDPFERPPILNGWDGLISKIQALKDNSE